MAFLKTIALSTLFLGALANPLPQKGGPGDSGLVAAHKVPAGSLPEDIASLFPQTNSSAETGKRDEDLHKRCTFADTMADGVPCDMFNIVLWEYFNLGTVAEELYVLIQGENFKEDFIMGRDQCFEADNYYSFSTPLPWLVMVHPGNGCDMNSDGDSGFDNTWIKYAAEFLNTPTDTRCQRWDDTRMRCLIPQRP